MSGSLPGGIMGVPGGGAAPIGAGPPPGLPTGLPPSMMPAPPGGGTVTMPQGNPGNTLQAMQRLKLALNLLQEALPAIPMGSAMHGDILKSVASLAKHLPDDGSQGDQGGMQALLDMVQKQAGGQGNAMLARLAGPPPNAPPAMGAPPMPPDPSMMQ